MGGTHPLDEVMRVSVALGMSGTVLVGVAWVWLSSGRWAAVTPPHSLSLSLPLLLLAVVYAGALASILAAVGGPAAAALSPWTHSVLLPRMTAACHAWALGAAAAVLPFAHVYNQGRSLYEASIVSALVAATSLTAAALASDDPWSLASVAATASHAWSLAGAVVTLVALARGLCDAVVSSVRSARASVAAAVSSAATVGAVATVLAGSVAYLAQLSLYLASPAVEAAGGGAFVAAPPSRPAQLVPWPLQTALVAALVAFAAVGARRSPGLARALAGPLEPGSLAREEFDAAVARGNRRAAQAVFDSTAVAAAVTAAYPTLLLASGMASVPQLLGLVGGAVDPGRAAVTVWILDTVFVVAVLPSALSSLS